MKRKYIFLSIFAFGLGIVSCNNSAKEEVKTEEITNQEDVSDAEFEKEMQELDEDVEEMDDSKKESMDQSIEEGKELVEEKVVIKK